MPTKQHPEEPLVSRREFEQQFKNLEEKVERLRATIEGPPHPGLDDSFKSFRDKFESAEETRTKIQQDMHDANQAKLGEVQAAIAMKTQRDGTRQMLIAFGMFLFAAFEFFDKVLPGIQKLLGH